jgi:hypothetical protein
LTRVSSPAPGTGNAPLFSSHLTSSKQKSRSEVPFLAILKVEMASNTNSMISLLTDLRRRHVFRVAALYVVAAWLLLQIADVIFPGLGIPETAIRYVLIGAIVGFPIALIIGWMYEVTPQGIVRTAPLSETDQAPDLSLRGTDYIFLSALALVADQTELEPSVRQNIARYMGEFYEIVNDPREVEHKIIGKCM